MHLKIMIQTKNFSSKEDAPSVIDDAKIEKPLSSTLLGDNNVVLVNTASRNNQNKMITLKASNLIKE